MHAERFELPRYFSRGEQDRLARELGQAEKRVEEELAIHVAKVLGQTLEKQDIAYEVVQEHPADAVLHTADKNAAGLIILGTHGLGGVKRLRLGSVAENVMHDAKIPVFIVRQKEHEFIDVTRTDTSPRLERILCACRSDELGKTTLSHAVSLAERFQAELTVLSSEESEGALGRSREAFRDWISGALETVHDFEPVVRKGNAADQIISLAKESDMISLLWVLSIGSFMIRRRWERLPVWWCAMHRSQS